MIFWLLIRSIWQRPQMCSAGLKLIIWPVLATESAGLSFRCLEAAITITDHELRANDVQKIIDLGKWMMRHPIELLDGVRQTLDELSEYHLILITKGDALDQEEKLKRSGLVDYFASVEVLIDKTPHTYQKLLRRMELNPKILSWSATHSDQIFFRYWN